MPRFAQVSVERGTSYSEAMRVWHDHDSPDDGFYLAIEEKVAGKKGVMLAHMRQGKRHKDKQGNKERLYNVYKPNTGLQGRGESLAEIKKKFRKVRKFVFLVI